MKNIKLKFNNITLYFLLIALFSGYIKNALIILGIILFHEFGHILMCLILGYKVLDVEIFPFGGITKIEKYLNTPIRHDLLIAIAGFLMQLIIFLLCLLNVINEQLIYEYNLTILIFNMLPIIPLDGSKILFELLNYKFSYKSSLKIYPLISFFFILMYFFFNYHYHLNNYLIIVLFVFKTILALKDCNIIHSKFLLERFLYDLDFSKVKNYNQDLCDYHKDVKYYYKLKDKIISEKDYLSKYYEN